MVRKVNISEDTYQNLTNKRMSFEHIFAKIVEFMEKNPEGNFKLMVGTDSQVHARETIFITGIVIKQEGKGVWACIKKVAVPRKMENLYERISYETMLSEEIFSYFTEERKNRLIQIVLPYVYTKGSTFEIEGHIDIGAGNRNKTRIFVKEMVSRIKSMGAEPKIKPEAFVASGYANRYTK